MSINFCSFSMFDSMKQKFKKSRKKTKHSYKIVIDDLKINFYWLN